MLSDSGNRRAGRVRVTADRLLSLTKEVRWPLSSINAAKRAAGKRSRVAKKILLKVLLKTKPKVYLKRT
jgi:hypothetical protein